jgi:hypothetical protein
LAQTLSVEEIIPEFTPAEESGLRRAFAQFTSANVVFTERNAASSGNFAFDRGDTDISVLHVPLTHTFGTKGDSQRLQIRAALGYLKSTGSSTALYDLSEQLELEDPSLFSFENQPDFENNESTSLSLGLGLVLEPIQGLQITPALDAVWTHVRREFDANNLVSKLVATRYDRDIFNNSTEAISYSPSLLVSYQIPVTDWLKLKPSVMYTHIWSEDLWSKSRYGRFSIDSGVIQAGIAATLPLPFELLAGSGAFLRPNLQLTDLHGAVTKSVGTNTFVEYGIELGTSLQDQIISEISLGFTYVNAKNFDGSRLSLAIEW